MSDGEAMAAMFMAGLMSVGASVIAGAIANNLLIGVGVGFLTWPIFIVFMAKI